MRARRLVPGLLLIAAILVVAVWVTTRTDSRTVPAETPSPAPVAADDAESRRARITGVGDEPTQRSDDASALATGASDAHRADEPRPTYSRPAVTLDDAAKTTLAGAVLSHDGQPVENAAILVLSSWFPTAEVRVSTRNADWIGRARTDDRGEFAIDVALGGAIQISAGRADRFAHRPRWFASVRNPHERLRIVLPPPGPISVSGRVRDELGNPIAECAVHIRDTSSFSRGSAWLTDWPPRTTTDAEGRWSAEVEAAGRYIVRVDKPGFAAAPPRVVIAGAQPGAEPGDTVLNTVLQRGIVLRGLVVDDETDAPLEGARVLWDENLTGVETHTNREGHFELRVESRAAPRNVVVSLEPYATARTSFVGAEDEPQLVVRLERPGGLRMRCVDADGNGLSDVSVVVTCWKDDSVDFRAIVADRDGSLVVNRLPPAPAEISILFQRRGVRALERTFDAPSARENVDIGDIVLPTTQSLRGVITRSDGEPAATAWVVAARAAPDDPELASLADAADAHDRHFARCDADGRFDLAGLTPGAWDLLAWGDDLPPLLHRGVSVPTAGAPAHLSLRLPAPVVLSGRVLDADGAPLTDGVAIAWREHPIDFAYGDYAYIDSEGRFTFTGFAHDVPRIWVEVERPDGDLGRWVDPREGEAELRLGSLRERREGERP